MKSPSSPVVPGGIRLKSVPLKSLPLKTRAFLQRICCKRQAVSVDMTQYGFISDSKVKPVNLLLRPLREKLERICGPCKDSKEDVTKNNREGTNVGCYKPSKAGFKKHSKNTVMPERNSNIKGSSKTEQKNLKKPPPICVVKNPNIRVQDRTKQSKHEKEEKILLSPVKRNNSSEERHVSLIVLGKNIRDLRKDVTVKKPQSQKVSPIHNRVTSPSFRVVRSKRKSTKPVENRVPSPDARKPMFTASAGAVIPVRSSKAKRESFYRKSVPKLKSVSVFVSPKVLEAAKRKLMPKPVITNKNEPPNAKVEQRLSNVKARIRSGQKKRSDRPIPGPPIVESRKLKVESKTDKSTMTPHVISAKKRKEPSKPEPLKPVPSVPKAIAKALGVAPSEDPSRVDSQMKAKAPEVSTIQSLVETPLYYKSPLAYHRRQVALQQQKLQSQSQNFKR